MIGRNEMKIMVTHRLKLHLNSGGVKYLEHDGDLGVVDWLIDRAFSPKLDEVVKRDGKFWAWWYRDIANKVVVDSHIKYVMEV